jgi:hypothetical protein
MATGGLKRNVIPESTRVRLGKRKDTALGSVLLVIRKDRMALKGLPGVGEGLDTEKEMIKRSYHYNGACCRICGHRDTFNYNGYSRG